MKYFYFVSFALISILIVIVILYKEIQYIPLLKKDIKNTNDDKIVLVCATGRSGSTTVLRLINTIPNSNICGENNGMIEGILLSYQRLKVAQKHVGRVYLDEEKISLGILDGQRKPDWYNTYNFEEIVNLHKAIIIKMFKDSKETNLWGFKEIRFTTLEKLTLLNEFKELFTNLKVILHERLNVSDQVKSAWWKGNQTRSFNFLSSVNTDFTKFYKSCKYCYLSSFENMYDRTNLKNMFEFIDSSNYYDERKISQVLSSNLHR